MIASQLLEWCDSSWTRQPSPSEMESRENLQYCETLRRAFYPCIYTITQYSDNDKNTIVTNFTTDTIQLRHIYKENILYSCTDITRVI